MFPTQATKSKFFGRNEKYTYSEKIRFCNEYHVSGTHWIEMKIPTDIRALFSTTEWKNQLILIWFTIVRVKRPLIFSETHSAVPGCASWRAWLWTGFLACTSMSRADPGQLFDLEDRPYWRNLVAIWFFRIVQMIWGSSDDEGDYVQWLFLHGDWRTGQTHLVMHEVHVNDGPVAHLCSRISASSRVPSGWVKSCEWTYFAVCCRFSCITATGHSSIHPFPRDWMKRWHRCSLLFHCSRHYMHRDLRGLQSSEYETQLTLMRFSIGGRHGWWNMMQVRCHVLFARDHTHSSSSVCSTDTKDGIRTWGDRVERRVIRISIVCHVFTYQTAAEKDSRLNQQLVSSQLPSSPFNYLESREYGK